MNLEKLKSILTYLELILPILVAFPDSDIDINPNPFETYCEEMDSGYDCTKCIFTDLESCARDSPENVKAMIKIVKKEIDKGWIEEGN